MPETIENTKAYQKMQNDIRKATALYRKRRRHLLRNQFPRHAQPSEASLQTMDDALLLALHPEGEHTDSVWARHPGKWSAIVLLLTLTALSLGTIPEVMITVECISAVFLLAIGMGMFGQEVERNWLLEQAQPYKKSYEQDIQQAREQYTKTCSHKKSAKQEEPHYPDLFSKTHPPKKRKRQTIDPHHPPSLKPKD